MDTDGSQHDGDLYDQVDVEDDLPPLRTIDIRAISKIQSISSNNKSAQNRAENDTEKSYANAICSTKYTWYTWLPKSIFEQFRRVANAYFLGISVLMILGTYAPFLFVSPLDPFSTIATLLIILLITSFKEGYEDLLRKRSDEYENKRPVTVVSFQQVSEDYSEPSPVEDHAAIDENYTKPSAVRSGEPAPIVGAADTAEARNHRAQGSIAEQQPPQSVIVTDDNGDRWLVRETIKQSQHVNPGEIVKLSGTVPSPVDMVPLLTAMHCDGNKCYIETANIDGETNLKLREAPPQLANEFAAQLMEGQPHPALFEGCIECEPPNTNIHKFMGTLRLRAAKEPLPVGAQNLVLRGALVSNTEWVYGVAIYTGQETKIQMNSLKPPSKMSRTERNLNRAIIIIFCALVALVVVTVISVYLMGFQNTDDLPYVYPPGEDGGSILPLWLELMFVYFLLFNNFIPLSLYVTIEMVNLGQSYLISSDVEMYHAGLDVPCTVRSSNMVQELGMVSNVFSDKTGTLTCNEMRLVKFVLPGSAASIIREVPLDNDADTVADAAGSSSGGGASAATGGVGGAAVNKEKDTSVGSELDSDNSAHRPNLVPFDGIERVLVPGGQGAHQSHSAYVSQMAHSQQQQHQQQQTSSCSGRPHAHVDSPPRLPRLGSKRIASVVGAATPNPWNGSAGAEGADGAGDAEETRAAAGASAETKTGAVGILDTGSPARLRKTPSALSLSQTAASGSGLGPAPALRPSSKAPPRKIIVRLEDAPDDVGGDSSSSDSDGEGSILDTDNEGGKVGEGVDSSGIERTGTTSTAKSVQFNSELDRMNLIVTEDGKHGDKGVFSRGKSSRDGAGSSDVCAGIDDAQLFAFLRCLMTCHTVVREHDGTYRAESPDELALVLGAARFDCALLERGSREMIVRLRGRDYRYGIMAVNPFNSDRKRMSVLLRELAPPDTAGQQGGTEDHGDDDGVTSTPVGGRYFMVCKGADNIMLPLCSIPSVEERDAIDDSLLHLSQLGLRTLVVAHKELQPHEATAWMRLQRRSMVAMSNRDELIARAGAQLEVGMQVVGVTAIEDRLQDEVPEVISDLAAAGIIVWMLTGDKLETAVNIGHSCNLLLPNTELLMLANIESAEEFALQLQTLHNQLVDALEGGYTGRPHSSSVDGERDLYTLDEEDEAGGEMGDGTHRSRVSSATSEVSARTPYSNTSAGTGTGAGMSPRSGVATNRVHRTYTNVTVQTNSGRFSDFDLHAVLMEASRKVLGDGGGQSGSKKARAEPSNIAVVLDGPSFSYFDGESATQRAQLLKLCSMCRSVVACRLTPMQKRELVALVKNETKPLATTLAIGDGANDVSMILEANVGVGIFGKEGRQAANNADFAIGEFKFLRRLLLLHGRYNYIRQSTVFLYSMHKNLVITQTLFWFSFFTALSGASPYESWIYSSFNFVLGLPIIFFGMLDRDLGPDFVLRHPQVYCTGRLNALLGVGSVVQWILNAIMYAVVICLIFYYCVRPTFYPMGLFVMGTITFAGMVLSLQAKVAFYHHQWAYPQVCSMLFSLFGMHAYFLLIQWAVPDYAGVASAVYAEPIYWLFSVFTAPLTTLFIDWSIYFIRWFFCPTQEMLFREMEHKVSKQASPLL